MTTLTIANEALELGATMRRNEINQKVRSAMRATIRSAKTDAAGLAAAMGYSPSMVLYVLDGDRQVSMDFFAKFCAAVDVPAADILAGSWRPA